MTKHEGELSSSFLESLSKNDQKRVLGIVDKLCDSFLTNGFPGRSMLIQGNVVDGYYDNKKIGEEVKYIRKPAIRLSVHDDHEEGADQAKFGLFIVDQRSLFWLNIRFDCFEYEGSPYRWLGYIYGKADFSSHYLRRPSKGTLPLMIDCENANPRTDLTRIKGDSDQQGKQDHILAYLTKDSDIESCPEPENRVQLDEADEFSETERLEEYDEFSNPNYVPF